jgi:hypothetical protein
MSVAWGGCAANQGIGNRKSANRVIGEAGLRVKEWLEVLAAVIFEFVDRADDFVNDGAEHGVMGACSV